MKISENWLYLDKRLFMQVQQLGLLFYAKVQKSIIHKKNLHEILADSTNLHIFAPAITK